MPHLTIPIDPDLGPIIKLLVGISTPRGNVMKEAGLNVPAAILVDFLVDTGASCTVLGQAAIAPLGLVATGETRIHTPTTGDAPESRFQFDVALMLYHSDNSRIFHSLPIIATDPGGQDIGGLLGRDVLDKCLMVYDGSVQNFSLAF